jgi:hypothetical protein
MKAGVASWIVWAALGGGLACAVCSACGDDATTVGAAREPLLSEPIAIRRELAFLDRERDAVWWVSLPSRARESGELDAVRAELPANPLFAAARSDAHPELLVRTTGLRGVNDQPRLVALDADGDARKYALGAPFTELETSEDGRYALASFTQGAAGPGAFAPSMLAVIDLDAKASDAVTEVSLELQGDAPSRVWLTPALQVKERSLQFALASFPRALALLDLSRPDAGAVELTLTGDPQISLVLEQVLFAPESGRIALRVAGQGDLFVIRLHDEPDNERGFRVTLEQFPAGQTPLHVMAVGESRLLLLTGDGRELRWIDDTDGEKRVQPLEPPSRELLHCAAGCRYALGYSVGAAELNLIELPRLGDSEVSADDPRSAEPEVVVRSSAGSANVVRAVIDEAHRRGILVHEDGAITLVDLEHGTLVPLAAPSDMAQSLQIAPDGSLWFAAPGEILITRVDAESRQVTEVLLEHPIGHLVFMPDIDRVVVVHTDPELALSVLDAHAPRGVAALSVRGPH